MPMLERRQRERTFGAAQEMSLHRHRLRRIVRALAAGEIPTPGRRRSVAEVQRHQRAIDQAEQDGSAVLDGKAAHRVGCDRLNRHDLAAHMADQVDLVNEVDEHRPAAGLAPPCRLEIVGRLVEGREHRCVGQAAERALGNHRPRPPDDRIVPSMMPDQDGHLRALRRGRDRRGVGERTRDRFLDQRHDAALDACDGELAVGRIRGGDDRCLRLHLTQEIERVGVPAHAEALRISLSCGCRFGDRRERASVRPAHRLDVSPPDLRADRRRA